MAVILRRKFGTLTLAPQAAALALRYRGVDDLRHAAPAPLDVALALPARLLPQLCAACVQLAQGLPARARVALGPGQMLTLYSTTGPVSPGAVPPAAPPAFLRLRYGPDPGQCVRFTLRPMDLILLAMTCGRVLDRLPLEDGTPPVDRARARTHTTALPPRAPAVPALPRPRPTLF